MRQWIALLAITCALDQMRAAECGVACKYLGYDNGTYKSDDCYCVDIKPYVSVVDEKKRTVVGRKMIPPSEALKIKSYDSEY